MLCEYCNTVILYSVVISRGFGKTFISSLQETDDEIIGGLSPESWAIIETTVADIDLNDLCTIDEETLDHVLN